MLVGYPDARLERRAEPRAVDEGLRAIGRRLLEAAEAANAYGLAAVHIGAVAPVVVISTDPDPAGRNYAVLYNPEIVALAEASVPGPEGSVAMPGVEVEIVRPAWAEVAWDDADGVRQRARFEGLPARVVQHEIDQMNGVFFLDKLSRLKRDMVLKRWKKRGAGP
ncbi:MAG: peptide deformylase [Devosia sp.]|uniref:peptide deformylase n=1 Tax=Devosia sp. TaxID=1871048 RepID=UPI001AC52B3E|nr:peptide deformylase [Devosia sp.]MBN9314600.1 peptide deformylase [Devosia sp.]